MKVKLKVLVVVAYAMLVVAGVAPCFAQAPAAPQGTPNTPATPSTNKAPQTLDAAVSLTAAYDNDLSGLGAAATEIFGPEVTAYSDQILANAEYRWAARDVEIRASGTSTWLHDRRSGIVTGLSRSGAAGLTARLPRRTTLILNQTVNASPANLYNLFPRATAGPGAAPPATHDFGASQYDWYTYTSRASLTHDATRRLSLTVGATGELSEAVGQGPTTGPSGRHSRDTPST